MVGKSEAPPKPNQSLATPGSSTEPMRPLETLIKSN
jgi:hypothetical protein